MTAHTFEAGATVYLLSGRACEYIAAAGSQHVVAPIYDTEYGQETRDHKLVDRVYRDAPTEKLADEVAALETQRRELRVEIHRQETTLRQFSRDAEARKARVTAHESLQRLDDYIAGKITHFVVESYDPPYRIETFQQAIQDREANRSDRALRLLSLFGRSNGDLTWNINRWSDGSGCWTECVPCTSYEDAEAVLRARIAKDMREKWAKEQARPWVMEKIVDCAKSFDVPVPDEIAKAIGAHKLKAAQDWAAKKRDELEQAEATLAAAIRALS
ncbi:hypothetical protein [Lysobacter capsici]|uniref:hypothetical protein n=1 Tax=Lysobacter capsici TaxID=435897 RepID=UPI001C00678C|nr:hypothetical protein [Lysobacter capsici]QWF19269.1 hypothetical protein KME82_11280 [Lysobacter capsici]